MRRTAWVAVLLAVGLASAARALRPPLDYAVGQWLLDYRYGLVPRGLVGTVLAPLWRLKTGEEIAWGIDVLALVVLVALLAALAGWMARTGPGLGARAAALAAMTSGWVVFAGHTVGYLDQLVALLGLGAAAGIGTRWRHATALLLAPAVWVHEIAVVFVPVVLALTVLAARDRRAAWVDGAWVVGPPAVALGVLALALHRIDPETMDALGVAIGARGAVDAHVGLQVTRYLEQMTQQGLRMPMGRALTNLTRPTVVQVALPTAGLLWAWTAATLWRVDRRAALYVPLASLAPLGLHFLGWDAARFTLLAVLLAAVGMAGAARVAAAPPSRIGGYAALGVIAWNVIVDVPLMAQAQDGEGVLWPRQHPTAETFRECEKAFRNAGFERGDLSDWSATGFGVRPATTRRRRHPPGTVGRYYATSADGQGGRTTGELRSPRFEIIGDTLLVAIGGDGEARLEVDGEVLERAEGSVRKALTGVAWRIPARARGSWGQVIVTDASIEGHVNVDSVCWVGTAD
ncbi:MAG: hypothetical protein JXB39_03055 [Deltaproteobacteria bacterium]|nr:hypothetical protein [Deltaproteobacteria bacterium]